MNTPENKNKIHRTGLSKSAHVQKTSKSLAELLTPVTNKKITLNSKPLKDILSINTSQKSKILITKKKLKFAATKYLEDEKNEKIDYKELSNEELLKEIEERKEKIAKIERVIAEKENLNDLIEKWKNVGNEVIEELHTFHPEMSENDLKENLLKSGVNVNNILE